MIIIEDNFISEEEADGLLSYFKQNEDKCSEWHGTYTLHLNSEFSELGLRLNNYAFSRYGAVIDWAKLVKWPAGSLQPLHFDNAADNTILSSILYLNDDYKGGQTFFEDNTIIAPKKKRALFFNGKIYKHGVAEIKEGVRYTLAVWYKPAT